MLALLAAGHLTTDMYQGALPAFLPILKDAHHLNYAQTGTIVLMMQIVSSVIQPLFGYFSDRTPRVWVMAIGVGVAAVGITLLRAAPSHTASSFRTCAGPWPWRPCRSSRSPSSGPCPRTPPPPGNPSLPQRRAPGTPAAAPLGPARLDTLGSAFL
jgi:hypothetical protein